MQAGEQTGSSCSACLPQHLLPAMNLTPAHRTAKTSLAAPRMQVHLAVCMLAASVACLWP